MFPHRMSWKSLYYGPWMALLKRLPPARADALNRALWQGFTQASPRGRARMRTALAAAAAAGCDTVSADTLATQASRMLARDCWLRPDRDNSLVEVEGFDAVAKLAERGQGAVLLGCHMGGYIRALHWLYRRNLPIRMLVQCPSHVSPELKSRLDVRDGAFPQQSLFVKRGLSTQSCVERILKAHAAVRSGILMYLCGDIPWHKGRDGEFLNTTRRFQTIWLDLALATGAPVIPVFGCFGSNGRLQIQFDTPFHVDRNDPDAALHRYLARLTDVVRACPDQAWPYWSWPAYRNALEIESAGPSARVPQSRSAVPSLIG